MKRPVMLVTLILLAVAFSACQSAPAADVPPDGDQGTVENIQLEDGSTISFPRHTGIRPARPDSLLEGQLTLEQGCLRVLSSGYETSGFLILWPADVVPRVAEGGNLEVLDGSENVIGRLGEPIRMGGGAIEDESSMTFWEEQIDRLPIESCPSPYWVAGVLYPIAQGQDTPMPQALATPYAQQPAAGICAEFEGSLVSISLRPDVPDPRCVRVKPDQYLSIKNETDQRLQVSIAHIRSELDPGEEITFETPFGEYLASGVHQLTTSAPPGGPEIWLVSK
jgi:hypothetical protein